MVGAGRSTDLHRDAISMPAAKCPVAGTIQGLRGYFGGVSVFFSAITWLSGLPMARTS
ncbi:hypothetical protein NXC14_PC00519 (plasmid) [Rhizobium sp. NXC14]|nr:hypothetical protein NXC14_PC00519 [Rhizobium sp. NXC14]